MIPNTKVPIASAATCAGSDRKRLTLYPNATPRTIGRKIPKNSANARNVQAWAMVTLQSGYQEAHAARLALTLPPTVATTVKNTTGKSSRPSTSSGGGVVTPTFWGGDGTCTSASGVGT